MQADGYQRGTPQSRDTHWRLPTRQSRVGFNEKSFPPLSTPAHLVCRQLLSSHYGLLKLLFRRGPNEPN
jgi:hypothetical protein